MKSTYTVSTWVGDEGKGTYRECAVTFDYYPGDPGNTSGPPERCYEGTDAEIEITKVLVDGVESPLTEEEVEELTDRLYETGADMLRADNEFARDGIAADAYAWSQE